MRVLHLFNEINFSGAELMYASAAKQFQSEGVEMLAFSTGRNFGNFISEFEKKNIVIFHKPYPDGIKRLGYYLSFYKFLKKQKIDLVHIHRSDLFTISFFTRIAGIKTIMTMHSNFKHRLLTYPYGILTRYIARHFYNVTFQTIGESVFENELNYYHNPSIRINNWYNSSKFYPRIDKDEKLQLREKLKIDLDRFVIISVGGCSENKNHTDILRAIKLIDSKLKILYVHLGSGDCENSEKELAKDLKIDSKVWFLGNKTNVRDYLIASDVYVMPSRFEGLSIASIEAMGCGLPSILYDSPGLRDLIKNNNNGFLIQAEYQMIAKKLIEYFKNQHLISEKGNSALDFVRENFSIKSNVSKMISLYREKN